MLKTFVFIYIWFVQQDIQKWLENKDMQFFMEDLKIKRKKDKIFLTFWSRDLNPRFSVIFPVIWIFVENEDDEIKLKQAAKKDTTLCSLLHSAVSSVRYQHPYQHQLVKNLNF